MSFNFSPKISTDGIILYLDASNERSYQLGSTWYDISRNEKNGTLVNSPTFSSSNNGSIQFDGVNEYITLPKITENQTVGNYTFSLWLRFANTINPSGTQSYMLMEAQNTLFNSTDNYLHLLSNTVVAGTNGRMCFQTFNPNSPLYTTTNNWIGMKWYNVVCSYDISTSKQRIYVNGVKENEATITNCYFNTNSYFSLSKYSPSNTWCFNGEIASFLVYSRTLGDSEILQNFNSIRRRFEL